MAPVSMTHLCHPAKNMVTAKPDPFVSPKLVYKTDPGLSLLLQSPRSLHRPFHRHGVVPLSLWTVCYSLYRRSEFFQGVSLHFSRSSVHLSAENKIKKIFATAGEAA